MTKPMLNVDDKVDEKVYEEKNEDGKDDVDDDDKVVRLVMKNIISKIYDDFIVLIRVDENNDELPNSQPHGCSNTSNEKICQRSVVATKSMSYNTSGIQTWFNKLCS